MGCKPRRAASRIASNGFMAARILSATTTRPLLSPTSCKTSHNSPASHATLGHSIRGHNRLAHNSGCDCESGPCACAPSLTTLKSYDPLAKKMDHFGGQAPATVFAKNSDYHIQFQTRGGTLRASFVGPQIIRAVLESNSNEIASATLREMHYTTVIHVTINGMGTIRPIKTTRYRVLSRNTSLRLACAVLSFVASKIRLASPTDNPGCDLVPDGLESICISACCAAHDKCYHENQCSFTSWIHNFFDITTACSACNTAVFQCIELCALGVPSRLVGLCPPGRRLCFTTLCGGRYFCALPGLICYHPERTETPFHCEEGERFNWATCQCYDPFWEMLEERVFLKSTTSWLAAGRRCF